MSLGGSVDDNQGVAVVEIEVAITPSGGVSSPQFGVRMGSQVEPECHFRSRLTPLSGDTILPGTSCATASTGGRHHRGAERRSCPGARSAWFAAKASVLR